MSVYNILLSPQDHSFLYDIHHIHKTHHYDERPYIQQAGGNAKATDDRGRQCRAALLGKDSWQRDVQNATD